MNPEGALAIEDNVDINESNSLDRVNVEIEDNEEIRKERPRGRSFFALPCHQNHQNPVQFSVNSTE